VYGDPLATGKPAGDDLSEGKRTVLVAIALERASASEARLLDDALGSELSLDEIEELRKLISALGADAEVERRITGLTARSLAALDASPVTDQARTVLRELAQAATQRAI
jgi:geranylgeranyl diphosphate synthase type I